MILPGDLGIVGGVVTPVVDVTCHWVVYVTDEAALDSKATYDREKAFRDAVDRVVGSRVSEFSYDVSVAQNDPVGSSIGARHGSQLSAEYSHLVLREIPRSAIRLRVCNSVPQLCGVEAQFGREFSLPLITLREILRRPFRQVRQRNRGQQQRQNQISSFHERAVDPNMETEVGPVIQ